MLKKSFYVCLAVFLFSLPSFSSIKGFSFNNSPNSILKNYNNQNPFTELEHLFFQGDIKFSFNLSQLNWYAGRCFVPYSNSPNASLLTLLPNAFYVNAPDRGPLFPSNSRMWILGFNNGTANEFDNMDTKKEKEIMQVLKTNPPPQIEKLPNSLAARWFNKGAGIALRRYNNYLIVQKFSLYNSVAMEYCYYFKKVK